MAAPIYVFKQADGTIKFTSKAPPSGTTAKVFTAREGNFSLYRAVPSARYYYRGMSRLYKNEYNGIIADASRVTGLDPALLKAVIHVESAFNPFAISPKGARGLMQLMPGTARDLGVRDSFAPKENIHGGARYLAMLLERYEGNLAFALAAYNAGADAVERYNGIPPYDETQAYVRAVLRMKQQYKVSHG